MKKGVLMLTIISLLCFGSINLAAASTMEDDNMLNNLSFSQQEITDIDTLITRAINGQSDISINVLKNDGIVSNYILEDSNGNEEIIEPVVTAQLLNREITNNGLFHEEIAVTSAVALDQNMRAINSIYDEEHDGSISVLAYSTIYYDYIYNPSTMNREYLLTKVTGGWDIQVGSIVLTDKRYSYHMLGPGVDIDTVSVKRDVSVPSSFTFSRNTGFTEYMIMGDGTIAAMGINTWTTINRGGSSWELRHTNIMDT